jgi:metal-responsive CopG/Arc/MetJ family transcriptional regulator
MATRKIAISIPHLFLKRVDQWAKKGGKSRSRFIVEELDNRLKTLEDEEITKLYNEACADRDSSDYDNDLAEEMLGISSVQEEEEKW